MDNEDRSDCADAHADLSGRLALDSEGIFSQVVAHSSLHLQFAVFSFIYNLVLH